MVMVSAFMMTGMMGTCFDSSAMYLGRDKKQHNMWRSQEYKQNRLCARFTPSFV